MNNYQEERARQDHVRKFAQNIKNHAKQIAYFHDQDKRMILKKLFTGGVNEREFYDHEG